MKRLPRWVIALTGVLLLVAGAGIWIGRAAWKRRTAQVVEQLRDRAELNEIPTEPAFSQSQLKDLPSPVARYFAFALPPRQRRIRAATIEWRGEFQNRPGAGWVPFTAEQHFTTVPPGFVWDARIRILPLASIRVRDGYQGGVGTMLGMVAGVVPVVDQGGTPEMAQSALARWLGEAVWFPTALFPGHGVSWEAVDDSTARATVSDGRVQASAEFHFAPTGEITRMTAMRHRDVDGVGVLTPFEGRYGGYQRLAGVMVPTQAEVAWKLDAGRFPYWRGHPNAIEYETVPSPAEAAAGGRGSDPERPRKR